MKPGSGLLKLAGIAAERLIRGYQLLLSPVLPGACRFYPSCSEYARQSVARFGVFGGGWLAVKRICRCHPWAESGYDPVPEDVSTERCAHGPNQSH